jgi:TusE/DsrC/DsvC family sulfur relay protein
MTMAQTMSDILNPSAATRDPDFPDAPPGWSRADAEAAAKTDGLTLDSDHWEVIKALQGWYLDHEKTQMRELHDALNERFHAKGGMKYLYAILPGGPVAQGCRLAGLDAPAGAADRSFGSVQ